MTTDILVKESMITEVATASPDQTVMEAADIMRKKDVGSLIICEDSKIIGILTREDIVTKVATKDIKPSDVKLKDIMNFPVVSIGPEEDIADAARKMTRYGFERLPVIQDEKLVGIISNREVAKVCPAAIEILRERLLMEPPTQFVETQAGDCELCGNYSEDLMSINSRWACPTCRNEAAEL